MDEAWIKRFEFYSFLVESRVVECPDKNKFLITFLEQERSRRRAGVSREVNQGMGVSGSVLSSRAAGRAFGNRECCPFACERQSCVYVNMCICARVSVFVCVLINLYSPCREFYTHRAPSGVFVY